ncbi:MAG: YvcK family protein [Candidatus Levyibacteriota bacterium]|nr:MAG: YvcK family protein [Candidatus Levybacteria bacterium]
MVDNKIKNKKIVCLGGGIGTVNLIKGIKDYFTDITVAVSMADEGGSAGRLRRLYNIPPPGDLVSCMAAIGSKTNPEVSKLLTYRFPGDRYANDKELSGHKLGSLILVAMRDITGDFEKAIELLQKTFDIPGVFLPATEGQVRISITTHNGQEITGEENIDLGKYDWNDGIDKVALYPKNCKANSKLIEKLHQADVIVAGPGDLYTTTLPVLIIPEIRKALTESTATKIFVVNITNKPYETRNYKVSDYIRAVEKNMGFFPFTKVIANTNYAPVIPRKYNYTYVKVDRKIQTVVGDLIDKHFPLYHDSVKLAKALLE